MTNAIQKEWTNQVEKSDQSKYKNVTNQEKPTKTSQKSGEVENLQNAETKAVKRHVRQQRSPKVYRSSQVYPTAMAINNRFESKLLAEQPT